MNDKFPKGSKNDLVWWGIIATLFCTGVFSWLAIVLMILNIAGTLPEIPELIKWIKRRTQNVQNPTAPREQQRSKTDSFSQIIQNAQNARPVQNAQSARPQSAQQTVNRPQTAEPVGAKKKTAKSSRQKKRPGNGIFKTVIGVILSAFMGISLFSDLVSLFSGATLDWAMLGLSVAAFALGLVLIFKGSQSRAKDRRFETLDQMLGEDFDLPTQTIADMAGESLKTTENDLQEMITRGYFPEGTWLDRAAGRLRTKPYSEPEPEAPPLSQAEKVLGQIRQANNLIADPVLSEKIDQIESLTRKIFAYQEMHPERSGQLRSFMNYYLPQTLKLLEAYARLEAQGGETESARQTKERINAAMDLLVTGYSRQLDKLLSSDAVDITADIKVMETMLARDGLTEELPTR
ncbi:MAG: 5-bromo-4-chloroindolyl phosphate hydrolysis family protein [Oscillospiraceae bacterium]|nr:5-bromo-4-chloroindolyl phosphate hydrolysis family protein [Oscillospiraceae bacterium]